MAPYDLAGQRAELEDSLRRLIGQPVMIIELDIFALPCGCTGLTANTRGLVLDDLEVFEEHMLKLLKGTSEAVEVQQNFVFARVIPGTQEIASLNIRNLCQRCHADFARTTGKRPRPDIYILSLAGRKK